MALLNPRDVKINRIEVHEWLQEWEEQPPRGRQSKEDWIRTKISEGPHADDEVATPDGEQVTVADLLIQDLDSYA